ncbi:MAG: hypothetical protein ACFFFH_00280 [Candidatus Thorarchaeota archaeon]
MADVESGNEVDRKNVTISPDGGSTWYFLGNVSADLGWTHYGFDVTAYNDSSNVVIRFSFDTIDEISNNGRGWMIDEIYLGPPKNEYFVLEIYQDSSATVNVNETIGFNATSYFNHDMNVSINITINGPSGSETLYFNDTILITAYSSWICFLEHNFTEIGYYDVHFILLDDINAEWSVSCFFDVYSIGYFDLFINQDSIAYINEWEYFTVGIDSYFGTYEYFTVEVNMTDMYGSFNELLYYNTSVGIPATSTWMKQLAFYFTQTGDYEVVYSVWDENNTLKTFYCYFYVYERIEGYYEISINQDFTAIVDEWESFTIVIDSYFGTYEYFRVQVNITDWDTFNETIYLNQSVGIPSESMWSKELMYNFTSEGYYSIILTVWDENDTLKTMTCYYNVYDKPKLDIWIMQPYWAIVSQPTDIDIQIQNFDEFTAMVDYFRVEMIEYDENKIVIGNDTIHEELSLYVVGFSDYHFTYTFTHRGHYEVHVLLIDEHSQKHERWCSFDVYEEVDDFMVLRLEQMRETWLDMPMVHWLIVDSHFHYGQDVDLELKIYEEGTTVGTTIFTETIWMESNYYYRKDFYYSFDHSGNYSVQFTATDQNNNVWETWCEWLIKDPEPNTLTYYVEQNYEARIDEEVWHDLHIFSYYNIGQDVEIEVWAHHYQEGYMGDILIFDSSVWIEANGSIIVSFPYNFTQYGHYDLDFEIRTLSDNEDYHTWCFWEIWQEWNGFDIWLDPYDGVANVDSLVDIELNFINNFDHSMNVDVTVYLYEYTSDGTRGHEEVIYGPITNWIEAQEHQTIHIDYTFQSEGQFELHAILIDDGGAYWETSSFWDVYKEATGPMIEVDAPRTVDVSESFVIEIEVFAEFNNSLYVNSITISHEDGTEIAVINIDKMIAADSSEIYEFTTQFDESGKYTLLILVDTDWGILQDDITVEVGVIEPNTTADHESQRPNISSSPGFDSLFIIAIMVAIIICFRKNHKSYE